MPQAPPLAIEIPQNVLANVVYTLPSYPVVIGYQSAVGTQVLTSMDGVNFSVVDTSVALETRSILLAGAFIKFSQATIVVAKKGFMSGTAAGLTVQGTLVATQANITTLNATSGRFADGTAAAPSITFQNETGLGISRQGAGTLRVSADNLVSFSRQASGNAYLQATYNTAGSSGGTFGFADGAGAAPDAYLGRYLAGTLGIYGSGALAHLFQPGGIHNMRGNGATIYMGLADDVALMREAANTLAMRNGTAAQRLNFYGTYTNASNYRQLALYGDFSSGHPGIYAGGAGTGASADLYLGADRYIKPATHVLFNADNQFDIGANGANRPRNIYVAGSAAISGTANIGASLVAGGAALVTSFGGGIFTGSGVPTVSAPKGSLYLRTDGTTTNDRAYINTNGSTGWTALTTAT